MASLPPLRSPVLARLERRSVLFPDFHHCSVFLEAFTSIISLDYVPKMPHCVCFGCTNHSRNKKEGITYHRFPKEPDLRRKWTVAVKRENWQPATDSRVCSEHFIEADFDRTSLCYVRLRQGVVPSVFPAIPKSRITVPRKPPIKRLYDETATNCKTNKTGQCSSTSEVDSVKEPPKKRIKKFLTNKLNDSPRKQALRQELNQTKSKLLHTKKKVKILRQSNRRLKKKIVNIESLCKDLREKLNIQEEDCTLLSSISKNAECLIRRSIEKTTNPHLKKCYEERLRAFAVTLHFLSPKAYSYVRKTFNTALPHTRTLRRWYSSVRCEPGFSSEVLRALSEYATKSAHPSVCSLQIDCMAIRKHLEWDGNRFHGPVNIGIPMSDDSSPLASEVLVFHLVFFNTAWKIPLGYFFVSSTTSEQLCGLVKQGLSLVYDAGVTVASLTCDGTSCNIAMANRLGCSISPKNLKTSFAHPSTGNPVFFFLDPSHMLKLVRNTLGDYGILLQGNQRIEWKYIKLLHEVQNEQGLHIGNKLTQEHVKYWKQKMKVRLAAQVFSDSVADSLKYLLENEVKGFVDSQGTIDFVRTFNDLFDVLNSRSIRSIGKKKALCASNIVKQSKLLSDSYDYIASLNIDNGQNVLESKRKTGFLGFLVCIKSSLGLYEELVGKPDPPLKYLPLYKISQDHLERLFGYIRSRGGCNNNPTCRQFTATFRRLLLHSELHESNTGNTFALDRSVMFSIRQKSELAEINASVPQWRTMTEDEQRRYANIEDEDDNFLNCVTDENISSDIASDIVEYIAGYVSKSTAANIICQDCISLLTAEKTNNGKNLISFKNRGGLIQPSLGVTTVCRLSETVLRTEIKTGNVYRKNVLEKMTVDVLNSCVGKDLFISEHLYELDPDLCHYTLLIRALCKKYFNIRLNYFSKTVNEKTHLTRIRNDLCKKVLFLGQ